MGMYRKVALTEKSKATISKSMLKVNILLRKHKIKQLDAILRDVLELTGKCKLAETYYKTKLLEAYNLFEKSR